LSGHSVTYHNADGPSIAALAASVRKAGDPSASCFGIRKIPTPAHRLPSEFMITAHGRLITARLQG